MPRGQIHINLPPEHPIMSFETIEIKMAAVSAKRSIADMKSSEAMILAVMNAILASHRHREVTGSNLVQVLNSSDFSTLLLKLRSQLQGT